MSVQLQEYTEAQLAAQPIGYWSDVTAKAVLTRIRAELAEERLAQPHWWTLNHVAGSPGAWQRGGLAARLREFAEPGVDFEAVFDELLARGWISEPSGGMTLTAEGEAVRQRARERLARAHERIHQGIPSTEYAVAVNVMRRMVVNLGGNGDLP